MYLKICQQEHLISGYVRSVHSHSIKERITSDCKALKLMKLRPNIQGQIDGLITTSPGRIQQDI